MASAFNAQSDPGVAVIQLYRLIASSILEQDYCNTLSYLTAHRHRSPASSQCKQLPLAVPQWIGARLLFSDFLKKVLDR